MGESTDFAGLCLRVDELESTVRGIATEQQAARLQRERQEVRMAQIETLAQSSVDMTGQVLTRLAGIEDAQRTTGEHLRVVEGKVESTAEVTDGIAEAVRWANGTRKVLTWIGSIAGAITAIALAIKLGIYEHWWGGPR